MINVSLARIMFGTNEDLHASQLMNAAGVPSLVWSSSANDSTVYQGSNARVTFGGLIQKAWAALYHKS